MLSEEFDDDPGCDGYVSEPDLVPADERSTLEFTMDRNNQLNLRDEPHDSLQAVIIISEENITESSVTRENPASSSHIASTFVNVISDPITLSVDTNYAVLEDVSEVIKADTSDPEIIFGAQQTVDDDSLSDTLLYQADEFPQSPLHILPEITLVLHHSNSFSEMIEAFSDPEIINKTLKVRRLLPDNSVEMGSGSGVVRDVYSSF